MENPCPSRIVLMKLIILTVENELSRLQYLNIGDEE